MQAKLQQQTPPAMPLGAERPVPAFPFFPCEAVMWDIERSEHQGYPVFGVRAHGVLLASGFPSLLEALNHALETLHAWRRAGAAARARRRRAPGRPASRRA